MYNKNHNKSSNILTIKSFMVISSIQSKLYGNLSKLDKLAAFAPWFNSLSEDVDGVFSASPTGHEVLRNLD